MLFVKMQQHLSLIGDGQIRVRFSGIRSPSRIRGRRLALYGAISSVNGIEALLWQMRGEAGKFAFYYEFTASWPNGIHDSQARMTRDGYV